MAEPRIIAYVGPSLAREQVHRLLPEARIEPPVRHGDLARLAARPGDVVLLIDGLFLHSAAVRHKEILGLLADGVTVAGSSSMGALRAAELWPYGMRGVGEVFELYRDGVIDGDDEVAIVHGDEEDGLRAMSEPMVNIRLDLGRATAAGVLDRGQRDTLVAAVKAQPFRGRSLRGLNRLARTLLPARTAQALDDWLAAHHVDAKAADARALLTLVANRSPFIHPHGGEDLAISGHDTMYAASWTQAFGGRDVAGSWVTHDAVAGAVALADPDFPRRYRAAVLAALLGTPADAGFGGFGGFSGATGISGVSGVSGATVAAPPPGQVERLCVSLAIDRGLLDAAGAVADVCLDWLTPAERELPGSEAVLRALARSHGITPAARLAVLPTVLPASLGEWYQRVATVRTFADLALRRGTQGTAGAGGAAGPAGSGGQRLRPELVDLFCAGLWGCPVEDLDAAGWDRGFPDREHLRRYAGDLAAHARWFPTAATAGAATAARPSEPAGATGPTP
ncbi:hypothetical protein CcI49_14840 [Frankia sp. CcI49]|uniref:TfuA-like protein n=1 Tax=Frankia sp. CcI49 TaxID=1745382 RepID=UPI0009756028|nr:TfuA-like protein [Frankia sp. CcI49]ONH59981.1 hypothetical protein CcI49_14840 [Frankia sp. CcI49]